MFQPIHSPFPRANGTRLETLFFNRELFLWTPWLHRIPRDYLKKMAFEKNTLNA